MKELDMKTEIAPQMAMELIAALSQQELSDKAKNWLDYFYAKALVSMQQFDKVESLIIDCLAKAIPEMDYGILVYGNILLCVYYRSTHSFSQEKASLELALDYAIQSGDFELLLTARSWNQYYMRIHAHFDAALKENRLIEVLLKQVKTSPVAMHALMKAATLQIDLQKTDKAVKYLHEALIQARTLQYPYYQLIIINNLSTAYGKIGEAAKAETLLEQGLQVAEEMGFQRQIVLILFNLGNLKLSNNQDEEAIANYSRCVSILESIPHAAPQLLLDVYNNLSLVYWRVTDYSQSIACVDKAIKLAKDSGLEDYEIRLNVGKTNILVAMGDYDSAQKIMVNAVKFYKKHKQYSDLIELNYSLGNLHTLKSDFASAYKVLESNRDIYQKLITQIMEKQAKDEIARLNTEDLQFETSQQEKSASEKPDKSFGFIGVSTAARQVLNAALLAAQYPNTNVMITGESGTGKEVIAQIIHHNSLRRNNSFVSLNVSSLASGLIENELFGHSKGAFTGADSPSKGFFLKANKGSFFMDEISEFPLELQSKLLRVLETRKVIALGSNQEVPFDCRIICATNQDIRKMVETNKFRLDLYHRLNTIEIHIPPLRERPEDIEPLVDFYTDFFAKELKAPHPLVDKSMIAFMKNYSFPGNVRELKNIIERMFILGGKQIWDSELLRRINPYDFNCEDVTTPNIETDEEAEIIKALILCNGKQKDAAKLLKMSEPTLYRRIAKYSLKQYTRKGN